MMERGRLESLAAEQEAWRAKMSALGELQETERADLAAAHDGDIRIMTDRMEKKEALLDSIRAENVKLRRSLDEAIARLQVSQEEVIDRVLMKNVLLDWHSKKGEERAAVMGVMASMLAFNDEEKERGESARGAKDEGEERSDEALRMPRRLASLVANTVLTPKIHTNHATCFARRSRGLQ